MTASGPGTGGWWPLLALPLAFSYTVRLIEDGIGLLEWSADSAAGSSATGSTPTSSATG